MKRIEYPIAQEVSSNSMSSYNSPPPYNPDYMNQSQLYYYPQQTYSQVVYVPPINQPQVHYQVQSNQIIQQENNCCRTVCRICVGCFCCSIIIFIVLIVIVVVSSNYYRHN